MIKFDENGNVIDLGEVYSNNINSSISLLSSDSINYEKTDWRDGDTITDIKMNNIENGIYNNASKLSGIEDNANNYVHPESHNASMITTDSTHRFITDDQINKLSGIEDNANNYVHPSTHPATMIVEDSTHRFVTDTQINNWDSNIGGGDSTNTYVHPDTHPATMIVEDSTHRFATDTQINKLAGIEDNANKYTHPDMHPATMITTDSTHRFVTDTQINKLAGIEDNANKYTHPSSHSASMITTDSTHRFITDEQINKLSGIENNANKYTHPSSHNASMITTDSTHRFVTDTQINNWNNMGSGMRMYYKKDNCPITINSDNLMQLEPEGYFTNSYTITNSSITTINGAYSSLKDDFGDGTPICIRNKTSNDVTLKHNTGSSMKFMFLSKKDKVLAANSAVLFFIFDSNLYEFNTE